MRGVRKLTDNQVRIIRKKYPFWTYSRLADEFNVTQSTIQRVISREYYDDVDDIEGDEELEEKENISQFTNYYLDEQFLYLSTGNILIAFDVNLGEFQGISYNEYILGKRIDSIEAENILQKFVKIDI